MTEKVSWARFEAENEQPSLPFQTIAQRMLALDLGIDSWRFSAPKTWPGVEADPVKVDGKWHSFQAKYYQDSVVGWRKLRESLNTTRKQIQAANYQLDIYHAFVNWDQPVKKAKKASEAKNQKQVCEEIAVAGGFSIVWHWGSQIIERLATEKSSLITRMVGEFFNLSDQPNLFAPSGSANSGILKYHYADANRLDFVERDVVVDVLNNLLEGDNGFVWHTLTGSAGVGKSRAILEYCLARLNEDWNWGWLLASSSFPFESWEPRQNTFIVVDYAMGRGNQLGDLLAQLSSKSIEYNSKVRVIVAERMEEPWLQSLIGIPTVGPDIAAHALRQTEGLPRSTKIQPFRAPKQCLLVESTLRK